MNSSEPRAGQRRWVERKADMSQVNELVMALDLHRVLARVLVARGIDSVAKAQRYLNPSLSQLSDPAGFAGMSEACERLFNAVNSGEVVGIFGDYDVDGVTSTVLLSEFLESLGVKVVATIPDRLKEGYGLSMAGLDRLQAQGAGVVVTVDCGITAHEEVDEAVARGIDVIVIDHHTVSITLPKAVAVINPHRADCTRQAEYMCAVGVVFNLCMGLRRRLREAGFFATRPEPNLRHLLDLVALGTVADVVPLVDDNRVFVQQGLELIREGRRPGLLALLDVAKIEKTKATASTLGFHLGPRVNAAGRLEDAMLAVRLLQAQDSSIANQIATQLDESNQSRRELEKAMLEEAIAEIETSSEHRDAMVTVVGREHWHPGVVGIVASRLVEKYGKPAIVVGEKGKGSGRSISAFHLHEALCEIKDALQSFGGHAHAVGVQLFDKGLESFRAALDTHAKSVLKPEDMVALSLYDGEIGLEDLHEAMITLLQRAAPFGRSNPEPVFCIRHVRVKDLRELKGGHLKGVIEARNKLSFIAFGMSEKAALFDKPADMLVVPEINEWMGRREVQVRVKDIRASAN